jgi:hypothetical protein
MPPLPSNQKEALIKVEVVKWERISQKVIGNLVSPKHATVDALRPQEEESDPSGNPSDHGTQPGPWHTWTTESAKSHNQERDASEDEVYLPKIVLDIATKRNRSAFLCHE